MSGCSTCDDYQFVPTAPDGMLERCPDCLVEAVRCPVHGRKVVNGRCPSCGREASMATDLLDQAHEAALVAAAAAAWTTRWSSC